MNTIEARSPARPASVVALTAVLALESACAFAFGIAVSLLVGSLLADMSVAAQFMAAGAVVFAIVAYFTARGVWRGSAWSFGWAAVLQVIIALAVAVFLFTNGFAPELGVALGLAGAATIALTLAQAREASPQA